MAANATADLCFQNKAGSHVFALVFMVMPFHVTIIYTLIKDTNLCLPRHKVLFSLSVSHGSMLTVTSICIAAMQLFAVEMDSTPCTVLRRVVQISAAASMVVSSLSLITLSLERYIACIHGLRLHVLVTEQRVVSILCAIWFIGAVCGVVVSQFGKTSTPHAAILGDTPGLKLLAPVVALPTAFTLLIIQARLFILSRRKILDFPAAAVSDVQKELQRSRKKQFKVAIVAGIVVVSYTMCTLPASCIALVEFLMAGERYPLLSKVSVFLWMANSLCDPLIYGIGMNDVRKAISRQIRKARSMFACDKE